MQFNVIAPNSKAHKDLAEQLEAVREAAGRFDYNGLVRAYNDAAQGAIIQVPYPKAKASQLVVQLAKRGLKRDEDYTMVAVATETEGKKADQKDDEFAFITRVSSKAGEIVEPKRGRKPMTDEEKVAARAKRDAAKANGSAQGDGASAGQASGSGEPAAPKGGARGARKTPAKKAGKKK